MCPSGSQWPRSRWATSPSGTSPKPRRSPRWRRCDPARNSAGVPGGLGYAYITCGSTLEPFSGSKMVKHPLRTSEAWQEHGKPSIEYFISAIYGQVADELDTPCTCPEFSHIAHSFLWGTIPGVMCRPGQQQSFCASVATFHAHAHWCCAEFVVAKIRGSDREASRLSEELWHGKFGDGNTHAAIWRWSGCGTVWNHRWNGSCSRGGWWWSFRSITRFFRFFCRHGRSVGVKICPIITRGLCNWQQLPSSILKLLGEDHVGEMTCQARWFFTWFPHVLTMLQNVVRCLYC